MEWHDRLEAKRRELGWSKRELHRRSGVPYDSVVKYLKGDVDNPRGDILGQLADAVGVTVLWLRYGADTPPTLTQDGHRIPLLTLGELGTMGLERASAAALAIGRTTPAIGVVGRRAFSLKIEDAANTPTLNPGDSVFCDPDMSPMPGALVIIRVLTQVAVRRYRLKSVNADGSRSAEFHPENLSYPAFYEADQSPVEIVAVATHRVHQL